MKITKKYMQKLIKEEIKRILREDHHHATAPGEGPQKIFKAKTDRSREQTTRGLAADEQGAAPKKKKVANVGVSAEDLSGWLQWTRALAKENRDAIKLIKQKLGM